MPDLTYCICITNLSFEISEICKFTTSRCASDRRTLANKKLANNRGKFTINICTATFAALNMYWGYQMYRLYTYAILVMVVAVLAVVVVASSVFLVEGPG